MLKTPSWKRWVFLGVAVGIMAASGGIMIASNVAFKINMQIWAKQIASQAPKRYNYISLPYSNPYPNPKALCNALGFSGFQQTIRRLNPLTGTTLDGLGEFGFLFNCSSPGPGCAAGQSCNPMPANVGLLVLNTGIAMGDFTGSLLQGSADDAMTLPKIYGGFVSPAAPKRDNWISVPYHTTWLKASDICVTLGLTTLLSGSVTRINGDPAAPSNVTVCPCSTVACAGTNNFPLVMGEAVLVRKNTAGDIPAGIIPPHF
jgi:hypothetical protein